MSSCAVWQTDIESDFAREALPCVDSVRRFALSLCRDPSDADDLVQDTYLRAYRSWHTFKLGTDCRRWLFTICRNVFRRRLAETPRTVSLDSDEGSAAMRDAMRAGAVYADALDGGFDDLFARIDLLPAVARALEQLPEPYRTTLILVDVEDQTYQSAAEALNVPIGTVRSRLFRARRVMQECLLAIARDAGLGATRDAGAGAPPLPKSA